MLSSLSAGGGEGELLELSLAAVPSAVISSRISDMCSSPVRLMLAGLAEAGGDDSWPVDVLEVKQSLLTSSDLSLILSPHGLVILEVVSLQVE